MDYIEAEFISKEEFAKVLEYDETALFNWANRISRFYWGVKFNIPIGYKELNVEKKVYGYFKYTADGRIQELFISNRMVKHNYYNPYMVEKILKHEMCHWRIFNTLGSIACRDGDLPFESEIRNVNSVSQRDVSLGIVKVIQHRPKKKVQT